MRSVERVCEKCKSFKGKIRMEMVLRVRRLILQSMRTFRLTQFSVGTKHTDWCKIFS